MTEQELAQDIVMQKLDERRERFVSIDDAYVLAKALIELNKENERLNKVLAPRLKIVRELKALFPDAGVADELLSFPEIGTDMLMERLTKLQKEIEDAPTFYGRKFPDSSWAKGLWSWDEDKDPMDTHRAKLVRIEEIK